MINYKQFICVSKLPKKLVEPEPHKTLEIKNINIRFKAKIAQSSCPRVW